MTEDKYLEELITEIKNKRTKPSIKRAKEWLGDDTFKLKHMFHVQTEYLNNIRLYINQKGLSKNEKIEGIKRVLEENYRSQKTYYDGMYKSQGLFDI